MEAKQDSSRSFPNNYQEVRSWFQQDLQDLRQNFPDLETGSQPLPYSSGPGEESLAIEWAYLPARSPEKLLVFTVGEHGEEGFAGSAVLKTFLEEYIFRMDLHNTGLLLIPWINPWGMKHQRRTNAANVDINRNFIWEKRFFGEKSKTYNPEYGKIDSFLNPKQKINSLAELKSKRAFFIFHVIWKMLVAGQTAVSKATLRGQYGYPQGIYYGGDRIQPETEIVMGLYRRYFSLYRRIIHLDMHTGYGPRYQMSIVNSALGSRTSAVLMELFRYPKVVKSNPKEFYAIQGDMIDFEYNLVSNEYPDKSIYATSFEFGTLGDSLMARLKSLQTMILENQVFHQGTDDELVREEVAKQFSVLYSPAEETWQKKVLADARQALNGILKAEGIFS